jgi:hypothetical protein
MTKPLDKQTVHMVGTVNGALLTISGSDVATLCGKRGAPIDGTPSRYLLYDSNGNRIQATTKRRFTSCRKCISLMTTGTLHTRKRCQTTPLKELSKHGAHPPRPSKPPTPLSKPDGKPAKRHSIPA